MLMHPLCHPSFEKHSLEVKGRSLHCDDTHLAESSPRSSGLIHVFMYAFGRHLASTIAWTDFKELANCGFIPKRLGKDLRQYHLLCAVEPPVPQYRSRAGEFPG